MKKKHNPIGEVTYDPPTPEQRYSERFTPTMELGILVKQQRERGYSLEKLQKIYRLQARIFDTRYPEVLAAAVVKLAKMKGKEK